ncbi:hypothetical protein [Pseudomonas nitroreducens]|uniref:hypothetical protein n=1 Tax=Pseudomonas nitroreducens TaxID=46680 RepID=UPI0004B959DF
MSAVITHALVDLERALREAPRGQRTQLVEAAAQRLGMSTLLSTASSVMSPWIRPPASAGPMLARAP